MNNIKFKEIKSLEKEDGIFKLYESDYYKLKIKVCNYGLSILGIEPKEEYIPRIYDDMDLYDLELKGFSVGTTSYGEVDKDVLDKIIKGYKIASATVEELEKIFIEK